MITTTEQSDDDDDGNDDVRCFATETDRLLEATREKEKERKRERKRVDDANIVNESVCRLEERARRG